MQQHYASYIKKGLRNGIEEHLQKTLGPKTLASYSAVSLPLAAMAMPMAVYLPPFYAEAHGLELATVGLVFTLARVWDVITDPLMGMAIDRFESRWGRRKHWVALSIPLLMVSVWMVFMPVQSEVTPLYLGFWLLMLYIGYTMLGIAHQSWGAELAISYDDRSRLFGWREIFVLAGMILVLALPATIELMGSSSQAQKVASMGWFCLILFPITVLPTLIFVPDKRGGEQASIVWQEAIRVILANRTLWRMLIADFATNFGITATGTLYIFMVTYVFELPQFASFALLAFFLAGFVAMPVWLKIAYKLGKHTTIQIAMVYGILAKLALFLFADPGNVTFLAIYTILYGFTFGAGPTLLRSMMADITDVDTLQTGKRRSGVFFALLTTTNKLGSAVAVGVTFAFLQTVFAFSPGPDNTQGAIDGLLITYCVFGAAGMFAAYLPLIRYPLTRQRHAEIRAALDTQ